MAVHTYKSSYPPNTKIDEGIKTFFEEFYKTSDTEAEHEKYADSFTKDAVLVMGLKRVVGREDILNFRKGMWTAVAARLHTPVKIFPFGDGEGTDELMLYGEVKYTLKDGRKADVEWAAKANMMKEDGKWKMGFYQVYLDSAALQNAK